MGGLEDEVGGKAKELEGKIGGDKVKEAEGKAQQVEGGVRQDAEDVLDRARDAGRDAEEKLPGS